MPKTPKPAPPALDLPTDPEEFFRAGPNLDALASPSDAPSVLERLGPSPFPKTKFPFLGFLATVYDHVATHARSRAS
jgi:hypothetical protein